MTPPRLMIVADDLTGALDSAGEAARLGIATRVFLSPTALARAQDQALPPVVAVSTGSRDGTAIAALQAMADVCACLGWLRPERVMKKVDSRLKGHVAGETAALASALGLSRMIVAPALPDMGRVQRGGLLSGSGIAAPVGIRGRFAGLNVAVPDIATAADMAAVADAPGLPVGARALASALVERLWPGLRPVPCPALPGPAVFAIGSRDPVTLAQLAQLHLPVTKAPGGRLSAPGTGIGTGTDPAGSRIYCMVADPGTARPAAEAGRDFAAALARRLDRQFPGTLIACGGETAGAILTRLGIGQLDVTGLALPGVPVSSATLADGRRLVVMTKSGGFGGPATLAQLAEMIDKGEPAASASQPFHNGNSA